jgi:hypothetical protein
MVAKRNVSFASGVTAINNEPLELSICYFVWRCIVNMPTYYISNTVKSGIINVDTVRNFEVIYEHLTKI